MCTGSQHLERDTGKEKDLLGPTCFFLQSTDESMSGLWRNEVHRKKEVVHDTLGSQDKESSQPSRLSDRQECPISSASPPTMSEAYKRCILSFSASSSNVWIHPPSLLYLISYIHNGYRGRTSNLKLLR
jgi:hypothetical protein